MHAWAPLAAEAAHLTVGEHLTDCNAELFVQL
jgi:hypothetical protein